MSETMLTKLAIAIESPTLDMDIRRQIVRAILAELREPSEEMLEEAWHATNSDLAGDPNWMNATAWQSMLDAILKEDA